MDSRFTKMDWLKSIQHVVIKLTGGIVSSNLDHLSIRPMSCVTGLIVMGVPMYPKSKCPTAFPHSLSYAYNFSTYLKIYILNNIV